MKKAISLTSPRYPKVRFNLSPLCYASQSYAQYQAAVKLLGSFRLAAGNRHLHRYCIFTELIPETVLQTLHYSTRQNLPDKELRYLRTVIVTADIHQGLQQQLDIISPSLVDLLALVKCHPLYILLRVRRELCF
jgi:hypothetical protein